MTNNIGKVLALIAMPLLGFPLPLTPLQILWSNVIQESLPSVGLATDPSTPEIMHKKPVPLDSALISAKEKAMMFLDGIVFGLMIMTAYLLGLWITGSQSVAVTSSFMVTLLSPQWYVFALREGNLKAKIQTPNILLKGFVVLSVIFSFVIIYQPQCNLLFNTVPIYSIPLLAAILGLSFVTPLLRLVGGRIIERNCQ